VSNSTASQRLWLVRSPKNQFIGPLSESSLVELLAKRELDLDHEICFGADSQTLASEGYWFFLHEKKEVKKYLGIEVQAPRRPKVHHEEVTETETVDIATAQQASQSAASAASVRVVENVQKDSVTKTDYARIFPWVLVVLLTLLCVLFLFFLKNVKG